MYLIIGLGNPDNKYKNNRHNVGFLFLDFLKEKYNLDDFKKKFNFSYITCFLFNNNIILLKPMTYMNLSGEAIVSAISFFKIEKNNIIVIYDDIAIPFSKIRIRKNGSSGGHNGIKNIIQMLGTEEFNRIRIGIDFPEYSGQLKNYVLSDFTEEQINILINKCFPVVEDSINTIINNNIDFAMSKFNERFSNKS